MGEAKRNALERAQRAIYRKSIPIRTFKAFVSFFALIPVGFYQVVKTCYKDNKYVWEEL